jgi:hypothetical protein
VAPVHFFFFRLAARRFISTERSSVVIPAHAAVGANPKKAAPAGMCTDAAWLAGNGQLWKIIRARHYPSGEPAMG